jgi:hypothetical protein
MKKYSFIFLLTGVVFTLFLSSCAVIGGVVGASADKRESHKFEGQEVVEIPMNQVIKIYRNNQKSIIGRFKGAVKQDATLQDSTAHNVLVQVSGKKIIEIPASDINYILIRRDKWLFVGVAAGMVVDGVLFVVFASKYIGNS